MRLKEIFANNNFIYLFFGRIISMTGSLIYSIVSILYIYKITQSGWDVGKLEIFSYLPAIILGMLGGAIADIYNRKKILIYSDVILGVLFIILSGLPSVNVIYIMSFLIGFIGSFSGPALQSILPQIVEKKLILQANSLFEVAVQGMRLLIPALGGLLFVWIGFRNVCILNGISYFLCALLVSRLKGNLVTSRETKGNKLGAKFKEFYYYLRKEKVLLFLIIILCLHYFGTGAWIALIAVFLKSSLHASDAVFGLIMSLIAGGTLIGGILAPLFEKKLVQPRPMQLSLILFSFSLLIIITVKTIFMTCFMFIFIGIGNAYFSIGFNTFLQQEIDSKVLGRVFGVMNTITMLANVISMGAGGFLCDRIGVDNVYLMGAMTVSLAAILSIILLKPTATTIQSNRVAVSS